MTTTSLAALAALLLSGSASASRPAKPVADSPPGETDATAESIVTGPGTQASPPAGREASEAAADPLDAVRAQIAEGQLAQAALAARQIAAEHPERADDALSLARVAEAGPVNGGVVGLLLPLDGRYGGVSTMLQQALREGLGEAADTRIELVAVEAGEDAAQAVAAFDALVLDRRPALVVGPLLSEQAEAVAARAETLGVPLLSMTGAVDPDPQGRWAFDAWLSTEQQVHALLDHAFTHSEARAFAVLAPDTDQGHRAAEAFAEGVTSRGGTVAKQAFYPDDTTDFREIAFTFVGRDQMPPPPRPKPGEPPSDVKGPPLLRVDAIFLPDQARRVPLVAAGLANEELAIGRFEPHDVPAATLLGLSGWNDPSLIASGGPYFHNALFTDVFVPPPPTGYDWHPIEPWPAFVEAYRTEHARTPRALEALAHDVGVLVRHVVGSGRSRGAIRDALLVGDFPDTVTGLHALGAQDRTAQREIRILSVRADGFRVVQPEPIVPSESEEP